MRQYAHYERAALCESALRLGPQAPTLCEGWSVRDLMAHIAMRDRRPEAVGVIAGGRLGDWAEHTRSRYTLRPFEDLVDMVRTGPHELSPFRLPKVGDINLQEFFIHHEDMLRGSLPEADASRVRVISDAEQEALYRALAFGAPLLTHGVKARVAAWCPGMTPLQLSSGHPGADEVVIKGLPSEVMLYLAGRMSFVKFEGEPDHINRFVSAPRSF